MGAFGRAQMSAIDGIRSHIRRNLRKVMPVKSEFPARVQRELRKIGRRGAWAPFKLARAPQKDMAYRIGQLSKPPTEDLLNAQLTQHVTAVMGRPMFRKNMNIPTFGGTWKRMMESQRDRGRWDAPKLMNTIPAHSASRIMQGKQLLDKKIQKI